MLNSLSGTLLNNDELHLARRPKLTTEELAQLKAQFSVPEIVELHNEKIRVWDLHPLGTETGTPIMIVPGYTGDADGFGPSALAMLTLGRRVIMPDNYHGIQPSADFRERYKDPIRELKEILREHMEPQLRKVAALIEMMERKNLEDVDVLAHSEGSIVVLMTAYLKPELFKKKALLNPAGLWKERNSARSMNIYPLIVRSLLEKVRGMWQEVSKRRIHAKTEETHEAIQNLLSTEERRVDHGIMKQRSRAQVLSEMKLTHMVSELVTLARAHIGRLVEHFNSDIAVAVSEDDLMTPAISALGHAARAGVKELYTISGGTHNVQKENPAQVTEFMCSAFDLDHEENPEIVVERTHGYDTGEAWDERAENPKIFGSLPV